MQSTLSLVVDPNIFPSFISFPPAQRVMLKESSVQHKKTVFLLPKYVFIIFLQWFMNLIFITSHDSFLSSSFFEQKSIHAHWAVSRNKNSNFKCVSTFFEIFLHFEDPGPSLETFSKNVDFSLWVEANSDGFSSRNGLFSTF